jgi:hypothetical protein
MYAQRFAPDALNYPPIFNAEPDAARHATSAHTWHAEAIIDHVGAADELALRLRRRLAERVGSLTGVAISQWDITVNLAARCALVTVDGVEFQLRGHDLSIVCPCAHCGTGRFETPPIAERVDLGYALTGWQAYHPECEPADPPEDTSW